MQLHHLKVQRTARYYTLGNLNHQTEEVWFVIHGFAQLAESFLKTFEPLNKGKRFFIAPEALNRFYLKGGYNEVGATWMTKEDREHEIEDYIQYLETLYDAVLENSGVGITVKVLGFSQGVATVSRWAAVSKKKIDTLILYAGEIGTELQNEQGVSKFSKPQNYFVYGTNDKIIPIDKLKPFQELLGNFTFLTFEGGHEINTAVLEKL